MTLTLRPRRFVLFLVLAAAAGCDFGSNATTPTAPDQSNVAYAQTDLTVGTGIEATNGSTASVQYAGWLYSDSTPDHKGQALGQEQLSFVVGATPPQVIKGFDQTVLGMKVGGTRRGIIPPSLAYGSTGNPAANIPTNAALVFDIALIAVQ